MAEWRNGGMAEWHNVQYKLVRNQDAESTQMPPWRSPSWLVFNEKLRCDALDIQIQNLVHKQDLCTIQKKQQGDPMY